MGSVGPPPAGAWTAGSSILHYRLESELGEGGMGQVWAAVDTRLGRRVALKAIPPELAFDPSRLERLRREARALATLNHPNIVTIFSIEETGDQQFLAMELVDGETLGQTIPRRGLPLARFFDVATALAEALSAAHEQGITHRDLKPENVMVSSEGRVKVLDFGLAKPTASGSLDRSMDQEHSRSGSSSPASAAISFRSPASGATLTREGDVVGTLPYMSPEQIEGRPLDPRSDIFSLGTVMYEMVTGRRPFGGDSPAKLISSILRDVPSSVTELRVELPRHLGRIIRQCMEKRPEDRFQSARDVFNQLRDLRDELAPRRGSGSSSRPSRPGSQARSRPASSGVAPAHAAMASRTGPTLLLAATFVINWLETWAESRIAEASDLVPRLRLEIAAAMHRLEGMISFQGHDNTNPVAIYGYSISYFFVLPLLGLVVAVALARRPTLSPYRVLALAVAATYAVSLPFYLLFPVPERWAYPDSGAVLLSDLWTTRLIETIRPISGIDNCFPSFHTSLTVVLVAVAFRYRMRLKWCVAALGGTVVLATFVLGIHWLPDVAAGIAAGILGIAVALRFERGLAIA